MPGSSTVQAKPNAKPNASCPAFGFSPQHMLRQKRLHCVMLAPYFPRPSSSSPGPFVPLRLSTIGDHGHAGRVTLNLHIDTVHIDTLHIDTHSYSNTHIQMSFA